MTANCFIDKETQPTEGKLKKALGKKYALWTKIRKQMEGKHGNATFEWKYYGKKTAG